MTLTKKFILQTPRENSGSNTSNAYDFQKNWSLWLLLDCHEKMSDYLIVFDYHEDVVVFDSEVNAQKADFFQVKTKKQKNWNMSDLISGSEKKKSIIGKMYANKLKFSCESNSVNFVTNATASFNFEFDNEDVNSRNYDDICCKDLSVKLRDKIKQVIKTEHDKEDVDFEQMLFFRVSELNISGHFDQTLGRLSRFLETKFPDKKSKSIPFYNALFGEIARKTDYGKNITEYADSLKRKSLSKSDFDHKLADISIKRDFTELWTEVNQALVAEGMSVIILRNIRDDWEKLEIHLMYKDNAILQRVFASAKRLVAELRQSKQIKTLIELLSIVENNINEHYTDLPAQYTGNYIKAIILAAFYE